MNREHNNIKRIRELLNGTKTHAENIREVMGCKETAGTFSEAINAMTTNLAQAVGALTLYDEAPGKEDTLDAALEGLLLLFNNVSYALIQVKRKQKGL